MFQHYVLKFSDLLFQIFFTQSVFQQKELKAVSLSAVASGVPMTLYSRVRKLLGSNLCSEIH
jgi:hypothetical protein